MKRLWTGRKRFRSGRSLFWSTVFEEKSRRYALLRTACRKSPAIVPKTKGAWCRPVWTDLPARSVRMDLSRMNRRNYPDFLLYLYCHPDFPHRCRCRRQARYKCSVLNSSASVHCPLRNTLFWKDSCLSREALSRYRQISGLRKSGS